MGDNSQSQSLSITPGNSKAATAQADYAGGCNNGHSRQSSGDDDSVRTTLAIYGGGRADALAMVEASKGVDGEKENGPGIYVDYPRVGMAVELRSHPVALGVDLM